MRIQDDAFLLTIEQAVERYQISERTLRKLYRIHKDFPVIRIGRRVLVEKDSTDRWFTRNLHECIETE